MESARGLERHAREEMLQFFPCLGRIVKSECLSGDSHRDAVMREVERHGLCFWEAESVWPTAALP